ncbi:MAG TPA: phosphotransferase family protein [Candidatus Limnocylindrales bacterium]|nr:phosphotransferase family protein [Candidatus Limnocylindrales bacterium]
MSERERVDPFDAPAPQETAPVRSGEDLDWHRLQAYLREQLPELSGPFAVEQFPHGAANLTYLLRFGDTELVLRRPPFGVLAPGAHDMRREHRVLSRLWRHFDRAPRAYLFCDDHSVAGADFFVMERRCGEVIRGVIPPSMREHADVGRRIGFALVDAMAELHLLDPVACELSDLGKPAGFVERQVGGWKHRWDLVKGDHADPQMDRIHARLAAAIPPAQRVSIVHNDLKLDNCQFDARDPDRVTAFFDWDMTTLGDPLIDLGTLLNYWPDPADPPSAPRAQHPGMERMGLPTRDQVVERYARRVGLEVSQAGWYEAFALWKTVVVLQQLHNRWLRGESTDPRMSQIAAAVPGMVAAASARLDELGL